MKKNDELEIINRVADSHSFAADFNGRFSKYRFKKFLDLGIDFKRVLEVGAGEGAFSTYISSMFEDLTLVEPATNYMQKLKENLRDHPHVKIFHNLLEDIVFNEKFDLVISCGVLEHVQEPQKFLASISENLKAGGYLYLTVPNATSFHREVGLEMKMINEIHELTEQDHRVGHFRYYDFDTLESELHQAGFEIHKIDGIMFKPLPNSMMNQLSESYCDALYELGNRYTRSCAEISVWATKGKI